MFPHPQRRLFCFVHPGFRFGILVGAVFLAGIVGCKKALPRQVAEEKNVPEVTVIYPRCGSLQWSVRQPGSIEAFEETPIVPRIAGYIQKWNVDIGDPVKKGDVLVELWIPDLVADLDQKKVEVQQARQLLEVAEAHVASAAAAIDEARAGLKRTQANLQFWQMQFARISKLDRSVIDKQVKEETRNQLRSAEAGVKEAEAKLTRSQADHKESEAVRNKRRVDIAVAEAASQKARTLVDYAVLTAPFDGVITQRNINTGDFVQPPAGFASVPLYVVQRRDRVRVFVDVPESDAVWVKQGDAVRLRLPVLKGRAFDGSVKRMSYAVKRQSRTLRAEIDLPNPDDLLRPGMYVQAVIHVQRSDIRSLPADALLTRGDVNEGYQHFCFMVQDGKVRLTLLEVGARGEGRVEVLKKQLNGSWIQFTGGEKVVQGELSSLSDGQDVRVCTVD